MSNNVKPSEIYIPILCALISYVTALKVSDYSATATVKIWAAEKHLEHVNIYNRNYYEDIKTKTDYLEDITRIAYKATYVSNLQKILKMKVASKTYDSEYLQAAKEFNELNSEFYAVAYSARLNFLSKTNSIINEIIENEVEWYRRDGEVLQKLLLAIQLEIKSKEYDPPVYSDD